VTHSFETVKIRCGSIAIANEVTSAKTFARLQLQGELQSKQETKRMYRGVFHGVRVIMKNEGMRGLLRGLNCAVRTAPNPVGTEPR
jgi:solute carrier family 25 protein 34/35